MSRAFQIRLLHLFHGISFPLDYFLLFKSVVLEKVKKHRNTDLVVDKGRLFILKKDVYKACLFISFINVYEDS
jgi:hypothetical protein